VSVRALFIKQDHASPSGFVGEAFTGLGYDVSEFTVVPAERFRSPDVTVTFPDPADYDAVVAFGAVWAVYDDTAIGTWVHDEIAFTRAAIGLGVPVLGICFGGQMLAAAAGGQVTRAPRPEIGWHTVETADPGLIDAGPWFQWHFDRFTAPVGIPVLARTALANQAFTIGRCLGLQFHPEVSPSVLECWLDNGDGAAELAKQGLDAAQLMERTRELAGVSAVRTRELVRRFLTNVATAPAVGPLTSECDGSHTTAVTTRAT
jgi:GMP synthase-like glutamine amidotransferase